MFSYHDTTDQKGVTLDIKEAKAVSQEKVILAYMRANPGIHYSPFDILENCYMGCKQPPIGSIRRALTNLTTKFADHDYGIRRSDKKKMEVYGSENFLWYYVPQRIQTDLFQ